jgi:hypothetical protein
LTLDNDGGTTTVRVSAMDSCSWTTSTNVSWITISSGSHTGNGTVTLRVARNNGNTRSGNVTVAGETLTIRQQGDNQGRGGGGGGGGGRGGGNGRGGGDDDDDDD